MGNLFIDLMKKRRSIYSLNKNIEQSEEGIQKLIIEAIKLSPSAFNSQSSRAVILFNDSHNKLWGIVADTLSGIVAKQKFSKTEEKIATFRAGFGTILFFEDTAVIKNLQKDFPLYAEQFPSWSDQSTAIAQHSVWTALALEDIGASLQHYNPLIDKAVKNEWQIPSTWNLRAQMPFGGIAAEPEEKEFISDENRFIVFN
ncbi:nitroreductase family protein [Sporosarcina sp. FSL K6-1508]|uniref:nitroreductase family protein n=1 Tax=Sporosarcina sp. FSL K6-1508 TaxID=2921553 RepID=UPI0030FCB46C